MMNTKHSSAAYPAQPSLFVPHGAPTFALRPGAAGAAMAQMAARLSHPRAVIVISPHWDTPEARVGTASRLETIHDFRGFPVELDRIRYPATGCAEASADVLAALRAGGFDVAADAARGLDHGAWIPLRLMFPDADIPVIPLSIQSSRGPQHHLQIGRALAPLAARGFLVLASGNLTHNLGDYLQAAHGSGQTPAYVRAFADWMWQRIAAGDLAALLDYRRQAPAAARAHPQEDHLLPLYVALGAAAGREPPQRVHAGVDDTVLAMDAFAFH